MIYLLTQLSNITFFKGRQSDLNVLFLEPPPPSAPPAAGVDQRQMESVRFSEQPFIIPASVQRYTPPLAEVACFYRQAGGGSSVQF